MNSENKATNSRPARIFSTPEQSAVGSGSSGSELKPLSEEGEVEENTFPVKKLMKDALYLMGELEEKKKTLGITRPTDVRPESSGKSRAQRKKRNKRKALHLDNVVDQHQFQIENMKKDIKLLTGVYEKEIRIAPNLLSEARIQRQQKYAEMEREKETEAFMKVVRTHEKDEEILKDERKRIQSAIDLFKHTKGWRSLAGAKTLTRDLSTINDIKNLNPQNPLSILVEMKVMIEKLNLSQGRMIAYEDFLITEYRMIRAQMRRIETRLQAVAKTREDQSRQIRKLQSTTNRALNIYERFIRACEKVEFDPLKVMEQARVPEKAFFSLDPNEQILYTENAEKRRRIIEEFIQELESTSSEIQEKNELKAMEEVLMGIHQEIDRVGLTGSYATRNLVSRFVDFYEQEVQEARQQNKEDREEAGWEKVLARSRHYKTIADFLESDEEDPEKMNVDKVFTDFESRLDKEEQRQRLNVLQEEELQYQLWRTIGEKTEEEIEEIKTRRKQNREDHEKLFERLISFGDGYVIQPPTRKPEEEWKDLKDPFGIRNVRFEDDGKLISTEDNLGEKVVTLEEYQAILKEMEEAADKKVQELTRPDMDMDEYYCRDDVL